MSRNKVEGKKKRIDPRLYVNESASVISLMSSVITSGASLDAAVRKVASEGPKNTSKMFRQLVCKVDCKAESDIRESLLALISDFPEGLSSFRRALFMTVSASDALTQNDRLRIMKEATDVVLQGIRQTGESYISKLQFPCMAVFGIGIMVPMIVLSLAPMLGIGGMFELPAGFDERTIRMVVLFLVPLSIIAVILSIKDKNPFMDTKGDWNDLWRVTPGLIAFPIGYLMVGNGFDMKVTMVASAIVGSMAIYLSVNGIVRKEKERVKVEKGIRNCLFDLGNRMVTGENFDSALVAALSMRKECAELAEALSREYVLCRGDLESAIRMCMTQYSEYMADICCRIMMASNKDVRDAGRMATAIAYQLQNEDLVRNDMKNKLRGMTDMMNGTAAVFAPLILGMSIMMMSPLVSMSALADVSSAFTTVFVYVIELAALISMFTALLSDRFRAVNVINRFATVLPLSMGILFVCSSIAI